MGTVLNGSRQGESPGSKIFFGGALALELRYASWLSMFAPPEAVVWLIFRAGAGRGSNDHESYC